ncbi:MAG: CoA transferase subunit A [Ignavibacteriales bacterium]
MAHDKLRSLKEVVFGIPDGTHIALGGFAIARNPIAAAHELIRQGKKGLTISQCIGGMDTDLLVGAGCVKELIYGGGSLDRFGPIHNVNRAIASGSVIAKEYSGLSMAARYLAGSLGLPHIPLRSLLGSSLLESLLEFEREVEVGADPFTGERVVLLRPLKPDYAIIHVPLADTGGNTWITGPRWDQEAAMAADHLVVLAERIAEPGYAETHAETVIIPACRVESVVHAPYGAHPTGVHGCYDYDADHLRLYVEHSRDPRAFEQYVARYVLGTADHSAYMQLVGGLSLACRLQAQPLCGYNRLASGGQVTST